MENLIKTNNSGIKVTKTTSGKYYYNVTVSGDIKGKTFGYFMYGTNKNNGGISNGWTHGVSNLVNCRCVDAWFKQESNSNNGFNAFVGGGLILPPILQA